MTFPADSSSRLLWAGFFSIFAAGIGFAIRGGILDNWGGEFGFNAAQLGAITGAGFSGFCFGIIIGGLLCDKIGYGWLVAAAFALHVLSALVTVSAMGDSAYAQLYWGMLLFGYANGTLEAVANPLVATLYPHKRTHFLNILHASWPAALAVGAALGWVLDDQMQVSWRVQLLIFLVPTALYGLMFLGQSMPWSEAARQGLPLGEMLKDVGILGALVVSFLLALFFRDALGVPIVGAYGLSGALVLAVAVLTGFSLGSVLLFVLFVTHALVGAVELGTDGWIQNITGNLLNSEQGKFLFITTSLTMFALRFCVDFLERRLGLSPVGILLGSALLTCLGLHLTSAITTFGGAMLALLIYAIGKTFFWPTMLAVTADRFPRTGAVAISIMGGIGMMSAGLLGTPGLGYAKDRFAAEALREADPALHAQYQSSTPSQFLFFDEVHGLDGSQVSAVQATLARARTEAAQKGQDPQGALDALTPAQRRVHEASIAGDRKTLKMDALIPAVMSFIYLMILVYFKWIGAYPPASVGSHLNANRPKPETPTA